MFSNFTKADTLNVKCFQVNIHFFGCIFNQFACDRLCTGAAVVWTHVLDSNKYTVHRKKKEDGGLFFFSLSIVKLYLT